MPKTEMPKTEMPKIISPAPYRIVPTLAVTFVATVAFTASIVLADDRPSGPPRPPEEAFTACDGKSAGASCTVSFTDRDGNARSLTGTCLQPPPGVSETRLFCAPPRPDGSGPPGPPPR